MEERLKVAMLAAREAGKVLRDKFDLARRIRSKGKRDIVTDADYAAERAVRVMVHRYFPRDHFLSEEDPTGTRNRLWSESEKSDSGYLWVVDPLDGTVNYAHRIPACAVSIGLYRAREVQMGVVYDPMRDELFSAKKGIGANLNGERIQASHRSFGDAIVALEWARKPRLRAKTSAILARMVSRALSARSTGSAALSMCYVAAGRFDIYFHFALSPWDVAAAACIVEEAGGRVTTMLNESWSVHSKAYLATNGYLHSQAIRYFH
jgi:myo-inositol-1(or 4)-monophosphatase